MHPLARTSPPFPCLLTRQKEGGKKRIPGPKKEHKEIAFLVVKYVADIAKPRHKDLTRKTSFLA